ncbi:MAG: RNA 2',3'-cyclic phosphodiesterase, partial [Acidimicrobiia bacterium]
MERLFVAAWPDAATAETLRRVPTPDERGVRWVPPQQWHVTLRFLGSCDRDDVSARLAAGGLPAATAQLGPAVDWLGPQLVVPVAGVDELAAAVHRATEGIGDPPRPRFRGHLTVARTRRNANSTVLGHPVTASFDVTEVALVRSDLTPDGPRYT